MNYTSKLPRLARLGALAALQIVLSRFLSVSTPVCKLGFGFIPIMLAGAMYGVPGGIAVALISDILGALLFPQGTFFIGYTITACISAGIYGLFFYTERNSRTLPRVLLAYIINAALVTALLNTLCIAFQYGYLLTDSHDATNIIPKFLALLPKRLIEAGVMLPIQTGITALMLNALRLDQRLSAGTARPKAKHAASPRVRLFGRVTAAMCGCLAVFASPDRLTPPEGTAFVRYLGEYVFTNGAACACVFALCFILLSNASRREGSRQINLCAAFTGALYTTAAVFSSGSVNIVFNLFSLCALSLYGFGAVCIARALCTLLASRLECLPGKAGKTGVPRFAMPVFCVCTVLILLTRGTLTADAYDQLSQFIGTVHPGTAVSRTAEVSAFTKAGILINDTQSPLHTLLLGGLYAFFGSPIPGSIGVTVFVCIQCILYALCAGYAVRCLTRMGLSAGPARVITAFYALFPLYPLYACCTYKESLLAIALLWVFTLSAEIIYNPGSLKLKRAIALCAGALVCGLIRGFALIAALIPVCCALGSCRCCNKRLFTGFACCAAGTAAVFAIITFILYPALGVGRGPGCEKRALMFQQTALYLKEYPEDITQSEAEAIEQTFGGTDIALVYESENADPVKYAALYTRDFSSYNRAWLSMGLRHPGVYLKAALYMCADYWDITRDAADNGLCLPLGDFGKYDNGFSGETQRATPGIIEANVPEWVLAIQSAVKSGVLAPSRLPLLSLLFRSGTYLYFCLFALAFMRKNKKAGACLPLTLVLYGVCLVFGAVSGSSRYAFPIIMCAPFTVLAGALMPNKKPPEKAE